LEAFLEGEIEEEAEAAAATVDETDAIVVLSCPRYEQKQRAI